MDLSPQEDEGAGFMQFFYKSDLSKAELDSLKVDVQYQQFAESFETQMSPLVRYLQRHNTLVGFNIMTTVNLIKKLLNEHAPEFEFELRNYNLIDLRVFFETYFLDKNNLRKLFGAKTDSVLDDRALLETLLFDLETQDSDSDIQTKTLGDGHTIPGRFFDVVKQKEGGVKVYYRFGKLKGLTVNKSDEHLNYMRWWIKQEGCTSAEKTFIKALMKKN
jgi:hypothetical protein